MDSIARNQLTVVDIRRLEDGPQKPLANAPWPPNHQDILNARCRLPVYGSYDQILDTYHQSQVMIRSGDTGSGKSTQVPQLLVHDEWASGLKVAGTQPRRLAAKELRCSSLGRNEEMGVRDTCRTFTQILGEGGRPDKGRLTISTPRVLFIIVVDGRYDRTTDGSSKRESQ
ncbi:uncharacterized protein PV06_01416 [Exophiala oligosperma]|uniref:Uncharacterized protein n=2 Tax=Chaetothyriales TaxID=34395 RepID=A0A0D2E239_9EURO|nr:uncharacterized protein PV06_01416 [Exophiala oligosperma]KAJ9637060.1 hypothetical protein H2204_004984 [Knufia peltigerae]KIW48855.1 hypothetical protein PV06_01416 [Exophiala oligosperma]